MYYAYMHKALWADSALHIAGDSFKSCLCKECFVKCVHFVFSVFICIKGVLLSGVVYREECSEEEEEHKYY